MPVEGLDGDPPELVLHQGEVLGLGSDAEEDVQQFIEFPAVPTLRTCLVQAPLP